MAKPEFGKREASPVYADRTRALKVHADYVRKSGPRRGLPPRRPALAERMAVWTSYYTLVFVAIVAFAPGTAMAAIRSANQCAAALL